MDTTELHVRLGQIGKIRQIGLFARGGIHIVYLCKSVNNYIKKFLVISLFFRCHSEHATGPPSDGRDGVEADSAPHHHSARNLPPATRKPLHLEKRVPGRHGEVRSEWEVGEGLGWGKGELFHIMSFISTRS